MRLLLSLVMVIVFACCEPNPGKFEPTKIWDIYSDIVHQTHESFIDNMQKKRPAEHRMVTWLRDNREPAYEEYINILTSSRLEQGQQVLLTPEAYFIEGADRPTSQAGLLELFKKNNIQPAPATSPHGGVVNFIEALANGSLSQVSGMVTGEFEGSFKTHDDEKAYWDKISDGKLYARAVVRRVDLRKDLKSGEVHLELIFFTEQKSQTDVIKTVTTRIGYKIRLSEEGTWLIEKQF
jgi:hypothetical protein